MKLQIDYPLIKTVRKSRTHRIPQNLLLQLILYFVVFFVMQLLEVFAMIPFLTENVYTWGAEQIQLNGFLTSSEVRDHLVDLMLLPENVKIMLLATGVGTLFILFYCRVIEGRRLRTIGFQKKNALQHYLMGLLAGFTAFSSVVGLGLLFGGLQYNGYRGNFGVNLLLLLIGFLIQGMSEEVLCRGFMMTSMMRHHSVWLAVGINSFAFGMMHYFNDGFSLFALLNLFLYAAMISLYVLRTNSLWGACAFHSIWNFAQGNFYGLPVSGIDVGDTVFSMSLKGSAFVNGGVFGLEASIGTTLVMAVWIAALLFAPNPFAGKKTETEESAA